MKKVKKLLASLASLALTVCLAALSFGTVGFVSAETIEDVQAPSYQKDDVVFVNTVKVGTTFEGSNITKIRDPFGVEKAAEGYTFERAGFYTLIAEHGGQSIDVFRIEAVTDGGELVIENTSAIPTYVAPKTEVDLSAVKVSVKAGEEDLTASYTTEIKYSGPSTGGEFQPATEKKITFENAGTHTIRFTAKNSEVESIVLTKDFTVTVQDGFSDEVKPTLTVSGVPSTANLGVKLTLPKATATDNSDTDVEITVTVTAPESGNKIYTVQDEDAYPVEWTTEEVVFDNNGNLSFYPQYEASGSRKYLVTYTAKDDSGNEAKVSYGINVTDSRSPDIELVDEELLPATWGLTVTNAEGNPPKGVYIPGAILKDNAPLDNEDVTVTLKNPDGDIIFDSSKTDIGAQDGENGVRFVTYADETEAKDPKKGYWFDPSLYPDTKEGEEAKTNLGTYTITYRGHDAKNQYRSLTRTFVVDATVTDEKAPGVTIDKTNPKLLYAGDAFPTLTQTIDESNGYKIEKKIQNGDQTFTDGKTDKGEKIEDAKLVKGTLTYTVTVTDVYGNVGTAELEIPVIDKTTGQKITIANTEAGTGNGKTGELYSFGKFTLTAPEASEYIGFEAFIVNKDGQYASAETTYLPPKAEGTVLTIEKIEFEPHLEGKYTLVLRAFEQGGTSTVGFYDVDVRGVEGGEGPSIRPGATVTNAEVDAYSSYTLPSYTVGEGDDKVVKISGTRYSIMNTTFIPMNAGDTYVYEVYARKGGEYTAPYRTNIACTSTTGITFKLMSEYQSYAKKFAAKAYNDAVTAAAGDAGKQKQAVKDYMVKIPQVDVLSKYGDVELKITVTAPSSQGSRDVHVVDDYSEEGYWFRNDFDGTYTITYTATSGTASNTYTLSIKSGDITLPTLDEIVAPAKNVMQNSTFKFSAVKVGDIDGNGQTAKESDITVQKTLIFDNSVVQSESGASASNKEYTLDRVGIYTVRYQATDAAGNVAVKEFTITVNAEGSNEVNTQVISTVLIIVAALLIIGLLIYFFAFRKNDLDKKKK